MGGRRQAGARGSSLSELGQRPAVLARRRGGAVPRRRRDAGDRSGVRADRAGAGRAAEARALRLLRRDDDAGLPRRGRDARRAAAAPSRGRGAGGRASARRRSPSARIRSPAQKASRSSRSLATSACAKSWVSASTRSSSAASMSTSRCPMRTRRCGRSRPSCRGCPCCWRCPPTRPTRKARRPGCARRGPSGCWRCRRAARHRCFPTGPRGKRRPGRRHAPPLGRLATARARDARGPRHGPADRRSALGGLRRARPGARRRRRRRLSREPYDRELYAKRRAEAARLPPDPEEVAALAELIGPRPVAEACPRRSTRGRAPARASGRRRACVASIRDRDDRDDPRLRHPLRALREPASRPLSRATRASTAANASLMGDVTLTWDEEQTSREKLLAAMAKAGFRELPVALDRNTHRRRAFPHSSHRRAG